MKFNFNLSRQRLQRKESEFASEWKKMAKMIQKYQNTVGKYQRVLHNQSLKVCH